MKQLIINADDFGMSPNYNKAILELIKSKLLTSTSVITTRIHSGLKNDINELIEYKDHISIGLHIECCDFNIESSLKRQYEHFLKIFQIQPTHIDLHLNTYAEQAYPIIAEFIKSQNLYIGCRKYDNIIGSGIKMISGNIYNGTRSSLNDIEEIFSNLDEGSHEIFFHPGYRDDYYLSSLQKEREDDMQKIIDMQSLLVQYNVHKVSYMNL